jgi:hypothetical protein
MKYLSWKVLISPSSLEDSFTGLAVTLSELELYRAILSLLSEFITERSEVILIVFVCTEAGVFLLQLSVSPLCSLVLAF